MSLSRRHITYVIFSFVLSFLAAFAPAALAGVVTGSTGQSTVAGRAYHNSATIATYPGSNHQASALTNTAPWGFTAPAGWVGSQGRLFKSAGGALYCAGSTSYNGSSSASGTFSSGSSCIVHIASAWYSYGISYGWNGNGYDSFYTFLSPVQNS